MSTIVFFFSHRSHQNSSIKLARILAKAGHSVIYAGPEFGISGDRLQENIHQQGFSYIPIHYFCPNFIKRENEEAFTEQERFQNFMFNLFDKTEFEKFINSSTPDLIFLDTFLPYLGIVLYQFKIPIVFASATLLSRRSDHAPPLSSMEIPVQEKIESGMIKSIWAKYLQKKQQRPGFKQQLDFLSRRHNFPLDKYFIAERSMVSFGLKFPELVFWPQELDFPRPLPELEQIYYLGGLVDTERMHESCYQLPQTSKPIVYCMLGTRSQDSRDRKNQFLLDLIKAMQELDQYYFIVSIGKHLSRSDFEGLEREHIFLAPFMPQITVLKQAAIMITHGGGDSLKECIRFAVPMLCFPHDNDQYGNAARIQHHQLGISCMMFQEELENFDELLIELLQNPIYRQNLQKFQDLFIKMEQSDHAVKIIETFLNPSD